MALTGHKHRWVPTKEDAAKLRCGDCKVVIEAYESASEETKNRLANEARRRAGLVA